MRTWLEESLPRKPPSTLTRVLRASAGPFFTEPLFWLKSRPCGFRCTPQAERYCLWTMFEEGIVTLVKIVGTLVASMSVVPLLFMSSPGAETSEPEEVFDTD